MVFDDTFNNISAISWQSKPELSEKLNGKGGRRGHDRDRMVVGFITTCAFSAYHH
jgi:hypothetical protein